MLPLLLTLAPLGGMLAKVTAIGGLVASLLPLLMLLFVWTLLAVAAAVIEADGNGAVFSMTECRRATRPLPEDAFLS